MDLRNSYSHGASLKFSLLLISLVLFSAFVIANGEPSPGHEAEVTLSPGVISCSELADFTVEIENLESSDNSILQVEIYKALEGISDFECGDAPSGWILLDLDRCIYVTGLDSDDKIDPGETLEFTFEATVVAEACMSEFRVVTVDDDDPEGDRVTHDADVLIDCTAPEVTKTVGNPNIELSCSEAGTGPYQSEDGETIAACNYMATQNTDFDFEGSESTEIDECNLGFDGDEYDVDDGYCRFRYSVNGGEPGSWMYFDNEGDYYEFIEDYNFEEDSEHFVEIECKDIAKNITTVTETDFIETVEPNLSKHFTGPQKTDPESGAEWIDTASRVVIESSDPDPHPSGLFKTYWRNDLLEGEIDWDNYEFDACYEPHIYCGDYQDECAQVAIDVCEESLVGGVESYLSCLDSEIIECGYQEYVGEIAKEEESCHVLNYLSIDNLGNINFAEPNCFFVDKTPPIITKEVGDPKVPMPPYDEFQTHGNGTAEWAELENYFGNYSARLYVPDGTVDIAAIEFDVDIALEDITELSFWQKISNSYGVNVILGIDADGDGTYESLDKPWHFSHSPADLGDDSFISMDGMSPSSGSWEEVDTTSISHWWTPNNVGDGFCADFGWNYLSDIQSASKCRIEPTDRVKVIRLLIGGSGTWMDKVAYVDDITLNGKIILEPQNWWITTNTSIDLSCEDVGNHPSNDVTIHYKYRVNEGEDFDEWTDTISEQTDEVSFTFEETSIHELEYWCTDAVDKESQHYFETDYVDNEPPIITKEMIGTAHLGDCPDGENLEHGDCYVADNGENGVAIHVEDTPANHMVDDVSCNYELWWETDLETCIDEFDGTHLYNFETGECFVEGDSFGEEGADIIFYQDSTHNLNISCQDALGNSVEDEETFLVDSTSPDTNKTFSPEGTYYITEGENQLLEWIDTATLITLEAEDEKVGVAETYYRVEGPFIEESEELCWDVCEEYEYHSARDEGWSLYEQPFNGIDESCHVVEYYSVDLLGNEEEVNWQCMFVDKTRPVVEKQNPESGVPGSGEPLFTTEDNPNGDFLFVTTNRNNPETSEITFTCEDQQPHPAGARDFAFRVSFDYPEPTTEITSDYCEYYGGTIDDGWCIIPLGEDEEFKFNFLEESEHNLEYYCTDNVGKISEEHVQYYKVDDTPPVITKEVVGPQIGECPGEECIIDGVTEIYVSAVDPIPHPVNDVLCSWDYSVEGGEKIGQGEEDVIPPFVVNFPEESHHNLTITCWDALGNETEDRSIYAVDKTAPVTEKTYGDPIYPGSEGYPKWVTSDTNVFLSASDDAGPHVSGVNATYYRVTLLEDDEYCNYEQSEEPLECDDAEGDGQWIEYVGEPFNLPEDSCHLIEYYSVDNVEKEEEVNKQCTYVDNQAPQWVKTVGDPSTGCEEGMDCSQPFNTDEGMINVEWEYKVTQMTPITLDCNDPEPHPVNNSQVCYRYFLDGNTMDHLQTEGDEDGWICEPAAATIHFGEDSMHQLEFYCEDALGNQGETDVEIIKVEGSKFDLLLNSKWNLVSVPFKLFNDNPDAVFAEFSDNIESVWTYDSEIEEWLVYRPDEETIDTLTSIEPGWGYWVYSNEDELVLTLGGSLFSTGPNLEGPPERQLMPGWNLIGYYGASWELYDYWDDYESQCGEWNFPEDIVFGDKAYCALNSLVDTKEGFPKWSGLWGYVNCGGDDGAWVGINACIVNPVYQPMMRMYAGRGYWVEMDVEDSYSPATTCIWNEDFTCVWTGGGIVP